MKKRKLTPKQQLFADEYIKSGNAYQSAIRAGYSEQYARSHIDKLSENVGVKSYIDAKLAEIESHKIADAKEILEYFTAVLRGETREVVVVATPTGAQEVEKAPDEKTKLAAARELLKRYPMSDEIAKEQLRKIKAEADMAESKARLTGWQADELTGKHRDKDSTVLIDNIEGNEE
ncbi:terminase small subunit [Ligilactobacillus saerimneri]|uniref:terminase small subunit n=1 Tax=Ligilactobacillus saerimneri TaxID=228229 RepID=UPI00040BE165|nr:terminase small subunit [Ligilactobacillus saerimneri]KRL74539.1 prophage lp2 protein 34 [Ligilactobacillus saerimneri DSM 16049]